MMRMYITFVCVAIMVMNIVFGSIVAGNDNFIYDVGYDYPTPTNKNESCIVNRTIWDMFEQIGGFQNIPNSTGYPPISVQLKDSKNNTHVVSIKVVTLNNYWDYENKRHIMHEIVMVTQYRKINGSDSEIKNATFSMISFGESSYPVISVTIFVDNTGNIHIFKRASFVPADVPHKFYLFYDKINSNGNIINKDVLFYFEKKGTYGPRYQPPEESISPFILGTAILLTGIAIITIYVAIKKSRGYDNKNIKRRDR